MHLATIGNVYHHSAVVVCLANDLYHDDVAGLSTTQSIFEASARNAMYDSGPAAYVHNFKYLGKFHIHEKHADCRAQKVLCYILSIALIHELRRKCPTAF